MRRESPPYPEPQPEPALLSFPFLPCLFIIDIAMAASSSHLQLARSLCVGGLSLPALSFIAFLTGFTFSLTLPSSLQALIPAMESLFFVSLPHLYRAFLSWVNPPCLFVLLNGIIMILTATSGRSSSSSNGAFSALEPNLALQIENASYKQSASDMEQTLAEEEPHDALILRACTTPASVVGIHIPRVLHLCREDAEEVELDPPKEASMDSYGDDKQIVLYMNPEEVQPVRTAEINPGHAIHADDPSTSSSACDDIVKGGSEPSSPHFSSSSPMKSNIRRSVSIDSAPLADNEGASEHLSEEAFRKRIEDFIFKVNSKLRSETRAI